MGGSTKNINTVPPDIQNLRGNLSNWLMGNVPQTANAPTGAVSGGLAGQVPRPTPIGTPAPQPQYNLGGQAGQNAMPSWMQNAPPPLPNTQSQAPIMQGLPNAYDPRRLASSAMDPELTRQWMMQNASPVLKIGNDPIASFLAAYRPNRSFDADGTERNSQTGEVYSTGPTPGIGGMQIPGGGGPGPTAAGGTPFDFAQWQAMQLSSPNIRGMVAPASGAPMYVNNQVPPAMQPQTYASMGPGPGTYVGPTGAPNPAAPNVQGNTVSLPPEAMNRGTLAAPGAFDRIFANAPGGPVQAQRQAFLGQPAQIDPYTLNLQFGTGIDPFQRGDIRDIASQGTQSVDQLGGVNSAFFNNMMGQLSPAFQQQRAEALAQAKAGLGNMGAGTALSNALGTAMNRSLGAEQAALANYASQGLQTEVGRQGADASRALQAGMANQGADVNFLNSLLNQGAQTLQAQGMGLQQGLANQGAVNAAQAQNIANWMNQGQFNANLGQQQNFTQAGLDQAWQQLAAQIGGDNAQRFMQLLLGMSTAGVGPSQVTTSGGPGALLGPIFQGAGAYFGSRAGR